MRMGETGGACVVLHIVAGTKGSAPDLEKKKEELWMWF